MERELMIRRWVSLPASLWKEVNDLAATPQEDRSPADMVRILVKVGLACRRTGKYPQSGR